MKNRILVVLTIIVAAIAVFIALFVNRGGEQLEAQPTAMSEISLPSMTTEPIQRTYLTIDIAHGLSLNLPIEYTDVLAHRQETHGALTTEVFSMRNGENDIPLYRIDFGDETAGDWFGALNIDERNIPVVYTVFVLSEEELSAMDEMEQEQYFALMDSFSDALNAIAADPRFSAEKPLAVGENVEMETSFWTLTLPNNMTVVESTTDGNYEALFYGEVAGERAALYQVRIGDILAESEIGLYEIDGVKKPISVGSFDLSEKPNWTEDDYSAAYRMMDTINHVIDTFMSSPQFSIPEAVVQSPFPRQ